MPRRGRVSDRERLLRAIAACDRLAGYLVGADPTTFPSDLLLQDGVTTQLTQIAENLKHVDDEDGDLRNDVPEVGRVIGMRNFIVHDYYDLDLGIVWTTATDLVPPLRVRLAGLLDQPRFAYG
jgi:uncharacterized protein with HEPN domain